MVKINLQLNNKLFLVIVSIVAVLAVAGVVYGIGSGNYQEMGHDCSELEGGCSEGGGGGKVEIGTLDILNVLCNNATSTSFIPIPDGYSATECKILTSIAEIRVGCGDGWESSYSGHKQRLNADRTVTLCYWGSYQSWNCASAKGKVNYIIICQK